MRKRYLCQWCGETTEWDDKSSPWVVKADGFCPMGCGPELTLHIGVNSGRLVCDHPLCPRPTAAAELLANPPEQEVEA